MSRWRWRGSLGALLVLSALAVIFGRDLLRSRRRVFHQDEPSEAERRLGDAVTRWIIELDRRRTRGAGHPTTLTAATMHAFEDLVAPDAMRPDPTLREAFAELLTELQSIAAGAVDSSAGPEGASRRLLDRTNELNRRLGDEGVPLLFYATTLATPTEVILHAYRVTSTIELDTPRGILPVRVVSRLDRLNVSLGLIGFQVHGDAGTFPVVLREQTRQHLIDVILPTLARRRLPLGNGCPDAYRDRIGPAAGAAIAAQVERGARSRLGRRGLDRLRELAARVADRREIWERWRERYSAKLVFSRIDFLEPPGGEVSLPAVPLLERRQFEQAQEAISDTLDAEELVAPLFDLVAARVARHEAQHYLDRIDPPPIAPGRSSPARSPAPGRGGPLPPATAELSAYLAEIASDPALPSVTWATLANAAGDPEAGASATAVAAALAVQALAAVHPDGGRTSFRVAGEADTDGIMAALDAFLGLTAREQALRARRAYAELFGRPPPAVSLRAVRRSTR